jgi:hypothetical protein
MTANKQSPEKERKEEKGKTISLPTTPLLPEDFQGGKYANHIVASFTQWEFYLDFWRADPGVGQKGAKLNFVERIIISPHNIKGLVDALKEVVQTFESDWGLSLPNMRGAQPKGE